MGVEATSSNKIVAPLLISNMKRNGYQRARINPLTLKQLLVKNQIKQSKKNNRRKFILLPITKNHLTILPMKNMNRFKTILQEVATEAKQDLEVGDSMEMREEAEVEDEVGEILMMTFTQGETRQKLTFLKKGKLIGRGSKEQVGQLMRPLGNKLRVISIWERKWNRGKKVKRYRERI